MCQPIPITVHCAWGGWLARSPKDAPIRIGVLADTERNAIAKFNERYRAWLDLPDPDYQI